MVVFLEIYTDMRIKSTMRLLCCFIFACCISQHIVATEMPRYYQPQSFSYVSSVIPAADNGFMILGYFKSASTDLYKPKVIKFDQKGDVQWEKVLENFSLLDFSGVDEGLFYKTPDNGYLMVNTYPSVGNNGRYAVVRKYNRNFDSVYTVYTARDSIGLDETFMNGWNLSVNKIVPTADGGFAIAGSNLRDCYNKGYILAIYSGAGMLTWKEITPLTNGCVQFRYDAALADKTADGGFIFGIGNRTQVSANVYNGIYNLVRKNNAGTTVWLYTINTQYDVSQVANKNVLLAQKELPNGNFKFVTLYDVNGSDYTGGTFLQYTFSPSGTMLQTDTFSFRLPLAGSENLRKVVIDKNENILVLGQKSITKLDKKGNLIWQRSPFDEMRIYDAPGTKFHLTCFTETPEGNYVLAGNGTQTTGGANSTVALFYITADGKMKTKVIYGGVFSDIDNNCTYSGNEKGYQNLLVKAEKYNQSFYTLTDTAGVYVLPVDTGIYKVSVQLPNTVYWKNCQAFYNANLTSTNPSVSINIPIQPKVSCPFLNVEIGIPYLRKCVPNTYNIYYCNSGTDTARNAYVVIDLDHDLQYNSATIPLTSSSGNQYRFNIGNVAPQACGSFRLTATVSCSATDGKTHCTSAHIYPDQLCVPDSDLYDGSNIVINGVCIGDTAVFVIKNTGDNMASPRKYIVIEGDFLRVAPQNYQLDANDSLIIKVEADGRTIRVQAQQDPNFPYPSIPSLTIESCQPNIDSVGLVNQFPQDDGMAFLSTSCVQNRNSYDPNEKISQPVGYTEEHVVNKQTEIKYTLHFQNCGTDTAYNVVVTDTLSPNLDITTLTLGASSHPYTFAVYAGNVLHFTFDNIKLPDSTRNKEASNGFVSFHLLPNPSVPNGTLVTNTAQIYFDYNTAIKTNQVYHTIDSIQFRITSVKTNKDFLSDLKVYPNPFFDKAVIELQSMQSMNDITMKIFDLNGKIIQDKKVGMRTELNGSDFVSGMYIIQFFSGNEVIATAKLIRQ